MGTVVAGTGTVNFATALANLSDQVFDVIAAPFSDTTSLNDVQDFLDGITGRWSPTQQLYGHYITAKNDTQANLGTFGNGRNDPHASIMGYTNSPSTPWAWASAIGGAVANRVNGIGVNLSRPFQEIELRGIVAPAAVVDRFSIAERQALYFDGIAGWTRTHCSRPTTPPTTSKPRSPASTVLTPWPKRMYLMIAS